LTALAGSLLYGAEGAARYDGTHGREMRDALDEVVREGAQRMLMTALEAEVLDFV